MHWTYAIKHKATASVLLFIVIGLVLANNISEKRHAEDINNAISSIYNDRMVVEGYIFQYAEHLQQVIETIDDDHSAMQDKQRLIETTMASIAPISEAYAATVLTETEKLHFGQLLDNFKHIHQHTAAGRLDRARAQATFAKIELHALSSIQISEAQLLMTQINKLYSSTTLSSKFEIAILIVIGLFLQALVFASRSVSSRNFPQQPNLN